MVEDEESMRICTVLDRHRYVYHDASSESGVGRYPDDHMPAARIPAVLQLKEDKNKPPDRCLIRGFSVSSNIYKIVSRLGAFYAS